MTLAPLPKSAQIRGIKGVYQVNQFYRQRGIGRLYEAERVEDGQPVTVREYLLPSTFFNPTEAHQRKQLFKGLAGLSLADGRVQDIRVVVPGEAIADPNENRCYLVTSGDLETYPSLKDYQALHGTLGEIAVRECLSQVLQTLEFLHGQKFALPNGQVQAGIVHGNLSLETVLLYPRSGGATLPHEGDEAARFVSRMETGAFTLYLCDLFLWERTFDPAIAQTPPPTSQDDLLSLGTLAFSLLTGTGSHLDTGESLNPAHDEDWPDICPAFKRYLLRLMGVHSPFADAETARRELLRLPPPPVQPIPIPPPPPNNEKKSGFQIHWKVMLLLMVVAFLAQLLAWLIDFLRVRSLSQPPLACCIADVPGVPSGTFTYASETGGTWNYIRQENLIERGKTLDTVLEERLEAPPETEGDAPLVFDDQPDEGEARPSIDIFHETTASFSRALQQVRQGDADFLMAGIAQPTAIDLAAEMIAYDGLAAIVAFSYARRANGLPRTLKGQISLAQLRQLYRGDITTWRQLGGADIPVKLYLPDSTEALRIVEALILRDRPSIERFRQHLSNGDITLLPTFELMRQIIRDFEEGGMGSVAIAPISQVFGQCSVYPLAIRGDRGGSVSPLVDSKGNAIRPTINLCDAKGSYEQNFSVFRDRTYPLAYPVNVVYRRDNRLLPVGPKFAEILKTEESQRLLQQAGLVPLQPLPMPPLEPVLPEPEEVFGDNRQTDSDRA